MEQSLIGSRQDFDKLNAVLAALTTIIAFIVYRLTVAPTLSYWDCGEFIACSHILGNPHPPGTPLFMLVGRFFDLLPIGADVAFRINMMSATSSTFTALFSYLIIVRLVSSWYEGTDHYKTGRIIAYAAAIIGALFVAFSRANWTNSVETEPRSMAIMFMTCIFWLGLKWHDHRETHTGYRIILLVSFLAILAIGIHLTVFLIIPIVTIFFSLKKEATRSDWILVAVFFAIQLLLIFILAGDYARYKIFLALVGVQFIGLAAYLRHKVNWPILIGFAALFPIMIGFYPFMFSILGWLVISFIIWFVKREPAWLISTLIVAFGLIGWTVHVYIPIRSTQHPVIDENTPSRDFNTFVNFLDRKQYGSMSMTERMFVRRGSWANQFGDHARMGFLRFFKEQYSNEKFFPVLFVIGLFGMGVMASKKPNWGYIFIALVLVASVGLVLYMNFADGTHYNKVTGDAYQEVRDRYYFFTPAFVLFGMAIGLGMAGILELIRKSTEKMGASTNRNIVYAASAVLLLSAVIPCQASYFYNDRSRNYMAYDYAVNLLNSCDENAILFTAGDNDTFPVWCVQEIYGIRKDVRVVNFSLLNTDWYIWQLKHVDSLSAINSGVDPADLPHRDSAMNLDGRRIDPLAAGIRPEVPISLTDEQILWETGLAPNGEEFSRPEKPFYDRVRKRTALLVPTIYDGKTLKVSQLMMEDIILSNKWTYPIHYTSAAGEVRNSPLGLMDRCYRQGVILKLVPEQVNLDYTPFTDSLFFDIYRYDNLSDTTVAMDENAAGIALAYPEKMLDYHGYLMRKGDTAKADAILERICEAIPSYWRSRITQSDRARQLGDSARAEQIEKEMMDYQWGFLHANPDNVFFYQFLGMAYYAIGDSYRAEEYFLKAWDMNIDKEHTFRALLTVYAEQRRPVDMLRVAQDYKRYHDDDPIANDVIRSAQMLMQRDAMMQQQQPPLDLAPQPQPPPAADTGQ